VRTTDEGARAATIQEDPSADARVLDAVCNA